MKRYEKIIYLLIGIGAFAILFWHGIVRVVLPPENAFVIYNWTITDTAGHRSFQRQDRSLPKVLTKGLPPGIFTYTATVEYPFDKKNLALVISHPAFQAFRVYMDGVLVATVGDMEHGNSNIWNGVFYFPIDEHLINDGKITVTVEGYGLYVHGFDVEPFIAPLSVTRRYVFMNKTLSTRVYNWAIGASLTVALSLFMLLILSKGKAQKKYLYFALASLLASIFYVDYTVIDMLPFSYLVYKKIIVISGILAALFIHRGILSVVYGEEGRPPLIAQILSYVLLGVATVYVVLGYDMISFKKIYAYLNLIVPIVFMYDAYILFMRFDKEDMIKREIAILLTGMLASSLFTLIDVYQLIMEMYTYSYTILISTYGMMIFIIAMDFALIYDYIVVYRKVLNQEQMVMQLKDQTLKDPLTGTYNRSYLKGLLSAISGDVCFLMLDIDHFKAVNDTYGHAVGDKVLKHIVSVISMQIRSHDIVIRYGGEEFLIVLVDTDTATGKIVAERIRKAIKNSVIIAGGTEIRVSVSIGVCCVSVEDNTSEEVLWSFIAKADKYLYVAKQSGRDKVVAGDCMSATT